MKIFKKYAFALLALITLTQTPEAKTVDWDWLKEFPVTAPLEHPYAFCLPSILNIPALAALYALKNYQNTISPLWAYVTVPIYAALRTQFSDVKDKNGKIIPMYPVVKTCIVVPLAFCIASCFIAISSTIGLAEAYHFSK